MGGGGPTPPTARSETGVTSVGRVASLPLLKSRTRPAALGLLPSGVGFIFFPTVWKSAVPP